MHNGTLKLPPGTTPRKRGSASPAAVATRWLARTWPLLFNPLAPVPLRIGIRRELL